jgi:hypothetical protein
MKIKLQKQCLRFLAVLLLSLLGTTAFAQNSAEFEKELKAKMADFFAAPNASKNEFKGPELGPSDAGGAAMVPTGFGGSGFNLFGGIGGVYPQEYTNNADLGGAIGVTVGNPFKFINVALSLNVSDMSELGNYSGNLILSRRIFTGSSIAGGITNLFASSSISDFAKTGYYLAFSHAVQSIPSKTPGSSRLTYGIGIGNGRFYDKSPLDVASGRGKHGTAVFANISYEIFQHVTLNAEWTGLNLGLSTGIKPFKAPLSLMLGVTNLTNYSSDKPNMVFGLGYPLTLTR